MRIVSGHQPVYLPWLGLFHKLSLCDVFVYMDTVQYLEQDWNNRNKIRTPDGWMWLTVPIDHHRSKGSMLNDTVIKGSDAPSDKHFWQRAHWRSIEMNYRKAPHFEDYAEPIRAMYEDTVWTRLVDLCWDQFELFRGWLGLGDTEVVRMSKTAFEGHKDRLVLDHCRKLDGDAVVFGAHGRDYVDLSLFTDVGIHAHFQDYQHPIYPQRFDGFVPNMCILDLFFNCGPESREILLRGNVTVDDLRAGKGWEPGSLDAPGTT